MPPRWELEQLLSEMDALRQRIDELSDSLGGDPAGATRGLQPSHYPDAKLRDVGDEIILTADVPGVWVDDLNLQVTPTAVTLSGSRQLRAPHGYTAHQQERRAFQFFRRFPLPAAVDPERADARVENGILTVHLPKVRDAAPRRIRG